MKRIVFFLITQMVCLGLISQNRVQLEVMKFLSETGEIVLIYNNDIKISNEQSFEITNRVKVEKIKEIEVKEVYFVCTCCGENRVYLQNILSSSIPIDKLYILVLGKNKIHFVNDSFVECSTALAHKLQRIIK